MSERTQIIDHGHVHCALRKRDVDIEECFTCGNLRDVRIDPPYPTIICRIDRALERAADLQ
jgi:hypothetical protein